MRILISGSRGLVGRALVAALEKRGDEIVRLVRLREVAGTSAVFWNPVTSELDTASLENFGAVIHLSGDNLAEGRWTAAKKTRIRDSRVSSTRLLAETLLKLTYPPRVFLCASAIGIYGNRSDELLTEESTPGEGFLASVCREWEEVAKSARRAGIRVAHLRFGMIVSAQGGALKKMLPVFQLGLGGVIGNGKQHWSWITIDDVVGGVLHTLNEALLSGAVNFVAPNAVTNQAFTKALGRALKRPAFLAVPHFATRIVFGEMADEVLLASQRVVPTKLLQSGYTFLYPDLEPALEHILRSEKSH